MTAAIDEIFVVTSTGSGHLYPSIQLSNLISTRNYKTTLVLPSNLLSSVPSHLSTAPISPGPPDQMGRNLESHLSLRSTGPLAAIVDFQMGWTKHIFWKFNIPVISFFTFGASAAAMEWGAWKSNVGGIKPGEIFTIPGLPDSMSITLSDLKRRSVKPSKTGGADGGPPKPGDRPPWVPLIEGSIGLMFNTCDDLELPFINYVADQIGLPIWGVGPLLPELYWQPSDSLITDSQIRQSMNDQSNYSEDEVRQWLDSKPRRSVIYVAFGSQVGPTIEEYQLLAGVLEDSTRSFIWVIPPKAGLPNGSNTRESEGYEYDPYDLSEKTGNRGLIIKRWAPQLMILGHPSTGGFLSHCGWNSTMEAIGRGVPILAWPIRGDQFYNAKLVVNHLKIGCMVLPETDFSGPMIEKENILGGIEKVLSDDELRGRAMLLKRKFESGFPRSSEVALDGFREFMKLRDS